jgi:hypothetical protein
MKKGVPGKINKAKAPIHIVNILPVEMITAKTKNCLPPRMGSMAFIRK